MEGLKHELDVGDGSFYEELLGSGLQLLLDSEEEEDGLGIEAEVLVANQDECAGVTGCGLDVGEICLFSLYILVLGEP